MPAPAPAPAPTSTPLEREREITLAIGAGVCLALPTVALLVVTAAADDERRAAVAWFVGAAVVAGAVPFLYWSPYRVLGLVPLAALGWLAAVAHGVYWNEWPAWAHGLPLGLMVGALACGRHRAGAPWEVPVLGVAVALGLAAAWIFRERGRPFDVPAWFVLATAVALAGASWLRLFRPLFELAIEPLLWLMYRVRRAGPGLEDFPRTGPCIILANHACWLDPIFLAKVLPRPATPMMTSRFYDLPVLRRLMAAFGVLRVPEKAMKKDAPEIQEAIAALDRGECVVIFPEGYLRRTENHVLRRFGQGVWQLLKARPNTPVFATWLDGTWGSYTSYHNGAPTKNKKKDFRRPIGVGMSAAVTLPPETLREHLKTRIYLMNLVLEARTHLALEPLPPFTLPEKPDETDDEAA